MKEPQEIRKFDSRIEQINESLEFNNIECALKALGIDQSVSEFNPLNFDFTSLELYVKGKNLSSRYITDLYSRRIQGIIQKIKKFDFEKYNSQKSAQKNKGSENVIIYTLANVEEITFNFGGFSILYRTPETKKLDEDLEVDMKEGDIFSEPGWGYGCSYVELSNIMPIFKKLANHVGFIAAVKSHELEMMVKGSGVDTHITEGYVKKVTLDYNHEEIYIPLKFK